MNRPSPTLFLSLILAVPMTALSGCCWALVKESAFERLDDLVDSYIQLRITEANCYGKPNETERTLCYLSVSSQALLVSAGVAKAQAAIEQCDQPGFDAALNGIAQILFGSSMNVVTPVEEVDIQAQGAPGSSATVTTIKLAPGATIRSVFAKGAPVMGPYSLSGSFTTDLQAVGTLYNGPVTALAFTADLPNQPSWKLTLVNSPSNRCVVGPAIGNSRIGNLMVSVRIQSGNTSWPLLLNIPLQVAADLSAWNFSTAGMVSTRTMIPTAVSDQRVGRGCPGSSGSIPRLRNPSVGRVGDPLRVSLNLARPNSVALLLVGESKVSWAGVPLPLDLTPFGAPGCSLHVSVALIASGATDGAGSSEITIPVPAAPTLVGAVIYQQWIVLDPVNALGAVMSGAARVGFFAR